MSQYLFINLKLNPSGHGDLELQTCPIRHFDYIHVKLDSKCHIIAIKMSKKRLTRTVDEHALCFSSLNSAVISLGGRLIGDGGVGSSCLSYMLERRDTGKMPQPQRTSIRYIKNLILPWMKIKWGGVREGFKLQVNKEMNALFFGEWSKSNVRYLIHILDCFHDVSGLKINLDKSRLFGIGVSPEEVSSIARPVNYSHWSLPFIYLGLPVGRSMKKIDAWNEVVNKFTRRLSSWKANILSIGGRLTLVKLVLGSLPLYYLSLFKAPTSVIFLLESIRRRFFWGFKDNEKKMVWVSWQKIMSSTKNGGLGVESIKDKNIGLMDSKVVCRYSNKWYQELGFEGSLDSRSTGVRSSSAIKFWAAMRVLGFEGLSKLVVRHKAFFKVRIKALLEQQGLAAGGSQSEYIDEFHKLAGDLSAIDTAITDEDQAFLLLKSLHRLMIISRSGQRDMEQGTYSAWSKSQGIRSKTLELYMSVEEHLKRDCPRYNHKKSQGCVRIEDHVYGFGANGYDTVDGNIVRGMPCKGSSTMREWSSSCWTRLGTRRANYIYTLDGQAVTRNTLKGRKQLVEYQIGSVQVLWAEATTHNLHTSEQGHHHQRLNLRRL
ncbi:hypothetical protein Tco_0952833 [Tanacetum coccineum]|uniref:Uncharacterized protein n=1 Tax=Tanacetum coccineum TaxID=301880 RepID=A0ABQ5E003_9ASTR